MSICLSEGLTNCDKLTGFFVCTVLTVNLIKYINLGGLSLSWQQQIYQMKRLKGGGSWHFKA